MATCKTCRQAITWERRGAKLHAMDPDGGNHWTHCRGRKKKKAAALRIVVGKRVTGAHYRPACGCAVPPWEACDCSNPFQAASAIANVDAAVDGPVDAEALSDACA